MDVQTLLQFVFLYTISNILNITNGEKQADEQVVTDTNSFLNRQNNLENPVRSVFVENANYFTRSWLEICEWLKRNEKHGDKTSKFGGKKFQKYCNKSTAAESTKPTFNTNAESEHRITGATIEWPTNEDESIAWKPEKNIDTIRDNIENEISNRKCTDKAKKEKSNTNPKKHKFDFSLYNTSHTTKTNAINSFSPNIFPRPIKSKEKKAERNYEMATSWTMMRDVELMPTRESESTSTWSDEDRTTENTENTSSFEDTHSTNAGIGGKSSTTGYTNTTKSVAIEVYSGVVSIDPHIIQKLNETMFSNLPYTTNEDEWSMSTSSDTGYSGNVHEDGQFEMYESNVESSRDGSTSETDVTQADNDLTSTTSNCLYTSDFYSTILPSQKTNIPWFTLNTDMFNLSNFQFTDNLDVTENTLSNPFAVIESSTQKLDTSTSSIPFNEIYKTSDFNLAEIDFFSLLNRTDVASEDDQKSESNTCSTGDNGTTVISTPVFIPWLINASMENLQFNTNKNFSLVKPQSSDIRIFPEGANSEVGKHFNSKSDDKNSANDLNPEVAEKHNLSTLSSLSTIGVQMNSSVLEIEIVPKNFTSVEVFPSNKILEQIEPKLTCQLNNSYNQLSSDLKNPDSKSEILSTPQPTLHESSSSSVCEIFDFVPASVRKITVNLKNIEDSRNRTHVPLEHFDSNAGFFHVDRRLGVYLFFWFFRSSSDCRNVPLIVWLQGEPGWSSLYGLFEEHGLYYVEETDEGNITLRPREFTWVKEFNVLYLDHSAECGFSMATSHASYSPTLDNVGKNVYYALYQFLKVFFEFQSNDLYLAGSYGGAKYIPVIAHMIHSKNRFSDVSMNLKGLMIGGPYIDANSMLSYNNFLYDNGLIDEKKQEELEINQNYIKSLINANKYKQAVKMIKEQIFPEIERAGYEKFYDVRYLKPKNGKYMFENYMPKVVQNDLFKTIINENEARFKTKSNTLIEEIMCSIENLMPQLLANYKILYYNGQFDLMTPYSMTAHYISRMHWNSVDDFYSSNLNNWYATNNSHLNGYWKNANNVTHVMIRDAGHTVGSTNSESLYYMLKWFVRDQFEMKDKKDCIC